MSRLVGIDVGGTKIAAAVVDPATGAISDRVQHPTRPERGADAVLADCVEVARDLRATRVGLGVCELVDLAGRTTSATTIDWRDRDLAAAFDVPCVVESDVRAAALAEARFGAGRGLASFLYVTISTGIAHCLVIDGTPWAGARGNAIVTGNPPVELAASGRALALGAERDAAAAVLAGALATLLDALDPAVLVVGGGLGLDATYRERWEPAVRERLFSRDTSSLPIVEAALGADAGIVGAALSATR